MNRFGDLGWSLVQPDGQGQVGASLQMTLEIHRMAYVLATRRELLCGTSDRLTSLTLLIP